MKDLVYWKGTTSAKEFLNQDSLCDAIFFRWPGAFVLASQEKSRLCFLFLRSVSAFCKLRHSPQQIRTRSFGCPMGRSTLVAVTWSVTLRDSPFLYRRLARGTSIIWRGVTKCHKLISSSFDRLPSAGIRQIRVPPYLAGVSP